MRLKELYSSSSFDSAQRQAFEDAYAPLGDFSEWFASGESRGEEYGLGPVLIDPNPVTLDADRAVSRYREICDAWLEFGIIPSVGAQAGHEMLRGGDDLASDMKAFLKEQEGCESYTAEYYFLPDCLGKQARSQLLKLDDLREIPGMLISYRPTYGNTPARYGANVFAGRLKGRTFWKAIREAGERKYLSELSKKLDEEGEKPEWNLYPSKSPETKLISARIPPDRFDTGMVDTLADAARRLLGTQADVFRCYGSSGPEGLRALEPRAATFSEVQFSRLVPQYETLFEQRARIPEMPGLDSLDMAIPIGAERIGRTRYLHFWDFRGGRCRLGVRVLDNKVSEDDVPTLEKHLGVALKGE
ncbi:hypothetical protein [Haloferula sp. A504]|uniref:hypothetical protein n=1 Tax=Haloferula sp. A504 TaxID=3373601 RepID=UPI0031C2C84F|nr:hypothetical protein [Verrucomicrobiaceae bacterium E54]